MSLLLTLLQLAQVRLQHGGVESQAARVQLAHKHALRLQLLQQRLDLILWACHSANALSRCFS